MQRPTSICRNARHLRESFDVVAVPGWVIVDAMTILYYTAEDTGEEDSPLIIDPVPSQSTIAAALTPVPPQDPPVERSTPPADLDEEPAENEEKLKALLAQGCGCKRAGGKPCSTLFTEAHFVDIRLRVQT